MVTVSADMQDWHSLEFLNPFVNPMSHCYIEVIQVNDEVIQVWNTGDIEK